MSLCLLVYSFSMQVIDQYEPREAINIVLDEYPAPAEGYL
jgi:hypothetical protein